MKSYIFPLLVTLLGLLAAYLFYALWHTETLNPPKIIEKQQEKTEDLSCKTLIPKTVPPQHDISTGHVKEAEQSGSDEKIEIEEEADIPNFMPEQLQTRTEALYEKLTPQEHEETMQAAAEAFEELDAIVEEQDIKLVEEMEEIEASQEVPDDEMPMEETGQEEYADMSVPEDIEDTGEINVENEDVNNL